jgi:AmmeMemoRadiSam system protein B
MRFSTTREASHQDICYTRNPQELKNQLNIWLDSAKTELDKGSTIKAIITPHDGYAFSGPTQGWAYKYLSNFKGSTVFLIGAFSEISSAKCGVSTCKDVETP